MKRNHLPDRFLKHYNILSNFSSLFLIKTKSLYKVAYLKLFETYKSILRDDSPEICRNLKSVGFKFGDNKLVKTFETLLKLSIFVMQMRFQAFIKYYS